MSELPENLLNELHEKENICAALEKLAQAGNIDYQAEIARLSDAYNLTGSIPPEYAELLDKRFAQALKAAHEGEALYNARQEKIAQLAVKTDELIAAGDLATLKEIEALEKEINELTPGSELLEKLQPLKAVLLADAAAVKAAEEAALALAAELETLCAAEDIAPLQERKKEIEAAFAQLANIPRQAAQRYNDAHHKAWVRLSQHYETIDLARWESYTRKLDVCAELEKMLAAPEEELTAASKKLNELREKWKSLGSVPNEKSEEINPRYLDLSRQLQRRIDEYFARKRQIQKIAAGEKEQLCVESEALADSADWKNTAAKLRELQAKWKTLPRAGAKENELYQRFRAAQDKFFNARKVALDARDAKFHQSEEAKLALIAEAENLTDPRRARQLREEFRNAGFAGKGDQELFQKFNQAMDNFFNARKAEYSAKENRAKELISEVEKLTAEPLENLGRIREIREELRSIGCRDTRSQEEQVLRKFDAALNEARRDAQRKKEESFDTLAMQVAQAYDAWKSGNTPELPSEESLAGFSKLQSFAKLILESSGGDEKAVQRLEKQIVAARAERERICSELEKLCGNVPGDSDCGVDLAAELQNAMLGNFGKGNGSSSPAADPQRLCAEFAYCGIVPAAELEEFLRRYTAAKAIIFPEKQA